MSLGANVFRPAHLLGREHDGPHANVLVAACLLGKRESRHCLVVPHEAPNI